MSFLRFLPGALLLAAPLLGHAQTAPTTALSGTPPAAAHRFYVGLAAYHSNYQNLSSWQYGATGFPVPIQLTAGYQLRPRLALELGAAYSGRTSAYTYDISAYLNGTPFNQQYRNTTTTRTTSISALARYTITRQPAHRLQVDALGGFTLIRGNYHSQGFYSNDSSGSLETQSFDRRDSFNSFLLTAGVGLRYRLTPRLGLNFDLTTNRDVRSFGTGTDTGFRNITQNFTGSAALGVRYRLGR